jgi:tetratricopeptide (TPR) repeat protein
MERSELIEGAAWLGKEFLKFFYSPAGVAGGLLDAFRGWKFSRSWVRFWFHLPSLVLLVSVYLAFAFSIFGREDSRIQLFSVESQRRCPTKLIEDICDQDHEANFATALGLPAPEVVDYKPVPISDITKRYVELLSKRILSIQPRNSVANYRLGMIYNINGQIEDGMAKMKELASGTFGDCPQANAWMVKELLRQKIAGTEISNQELLINLEKASKWRDVDFRLVSFYARVLEESGETLKAIAVAKQAASARPELNLELARLYGRVGYQNEMRSAASVVEDIFLKRLNSPLEKTSDRLAVAEARKMTDRLEQAADILREGLLNKSTGPAIRRELSEVLRLIYVKSISRTDAGLYQADLAQLEKAGEADPLNPNISNEIAKLLSFRIKPTKKLLETLKQQIDAGITSSAAHIYLAEGYFEFGNAKEAMKNWELALAKDPNNIGALNNLALVLAKMSDANVERSLNLLNKALSLSPGNAEILDSLGDVLMMAKRPKDAINKFELSIRNDSSRIKTRKKLVGAYELNGMDDMAAALKKVIQKMENAQSDEQMQSKE